MTSHTNRPVRRLILITLALQAGSHANTLYTFGNPTGEEQAYIEYINRARANPAAEGVRLAAATDPAILNAYTYFGVNLAMMQSEMSAIPAAQPLAPNGKLTNAARGHSQWMLANGVQTHNQTNPSNTPWDRITAAGYDYYDAGENVAGTVVNPWHGHAGFQVDWGPGGPGGMQAGRGHRTSIHHGDFREIGVGVVNGSNGGVGPQLVTQDFGDPEVLQCFGTGVAYYDVNGNNFYDAGEGIAGLNVSVSGVTYYCTSATGGGWAVPVPEDEMTRKVTFSGLGINQTRDLVIPEWRNAKADLKLSYSPPTITSAATANAGTAHTFSFTAVGGATGYKMNRWTLAAAEAEGCDSVANVTTATTGSYTVLNTAVKHSGTGSFHLANPGTANKNQIVELKTVYRGQAAPVLKFQSRLRNSTGDEKHRVQVKEEGTNTWVDVYTQSGGSGQEMAFSEKTVNLTSVANKKFRVRFILSFTTGSSYGSTEDNFGWFIDTITFTNTSGLTGNVSETLAGTSKSLSPAAGTYLVSVAPIISGTEFPGADQLLTVAGAPVSGYAAWAAPLETSNGLTAGTLANHPNGDHDKDGRANLVEYAFGTSPVTANETAARMPAIQGGAADFKVRYVKDTSLADVTLTPVASMDLTTWMSPGQAGAPAGFTDSLISTAGNLQTREAVIPAAAGATWFLKVKVTKN